jgi:hypothetical protein
VMKVSATVVATTTFVVEEDPAAGVEVSVWGFIPSPPGLAVRLGARSW